MRLWVGYARRAARGSAPRRGTSARRARSRDVGPYLGRPHVKQQRARGRNITPLTTLKMAAFMPSPRANVRMAMQAKPGDFRSVRNAWHRPCHSRSQAVQPHCATLASAEARRPAPGFSGSACRGFRAGWRDSVQRRPSIVGGRPAATGCGKRGLIAICVSLYGSQLSFASVFCRYTPSSPDV